MSRLYESLQRVEMEQRRSGAPASKLAHTVDFLTSVTADGVLEGALSVNTKVLPGSHLVAMTESKCLAAEKFRVLVTRLENLRNEQELKSLLVTSSVIDEGKTVISGNLAVTLATHIGARVLLVEGDWHRPSLASLLGLSRLRGLSHWWSGQEKDIARCIYKLDEMPLWFLGADACDQPSTILQSARFAEAFAKLGNYFDWIVVDSTPIYPTVDVNVWLRLVDGMLLVVREGVAPIKALQKGLQSLDTPKLIGVVLNDASESEQMNYAGQYHGTRKPARKH